MKKQKTKLGARILSEQELNMILPNASSVLEQIAVFRENIAGMKENREQEPEQKTNNIGIIGCRGAGKTSVLKTFKEMLRQQNIARDKNPESGRDILLPLIVPENMSSGTTLMDVVLGMLKSKVDETKKEAERERGDCIYSGRNSLEKEYNELVKQYCYIKKDYRDILIQQFTTEQNYVDKTKEVFNSDTEFISLFRQFVEHLLQGNNRDAGKDNDALLFLFIDDIDLSTTRCMDVVRTLLSYLSIPRIVTFISGDMVTFEEALTLDFLRQENALREGVLGERYYSMTEKGGKTLLERKKELAYEYLKKIIPPAYRKEIKYWSLEERGAYLIAEDDEKNQKNLAELLEAVTGNKISKGYFSYEENGQVKYMGPVFHMFDITSRGLNNVYNVLMELYEQKEDELPSSLSSQGIVVSAESIKRKKMSDNWRLIETLVDSKQLYFKHKEQLLQKMIILEQEQVKIDFKSAENFLYGPENDRQESVEGEEEKKGGSAEIFSPEDRFAIFILIDFAFHLFKSREFEKEVYAKLKNRIIEEYISNETIDGKIAKRSRTLKLQGNVPVDINGKRNVNIALIVLYNLLHHGDLTLDLYMVKYLGRNEIYRIFIGDVWKDTTQTDIYKIAYALTRALDALCGTIEKRRAYLADLYVRAPKAMLALLDNISSDRWIIFAEQLMPEISVSLSKRHFELATSKDKQFFWDMANKSQENTDNYIHEARIWQDTDHCLCAERENKGFLYWIFYEKQKEGKKDVFDLKEMNRKLLHVGIKSALIRQLNRTVINNQYEIKELSEAEYDFHLIGDIARDKKKYDAIMLIDDKGLWEEEYVKTDVRRYLENEIEEYVVKIAEDVLIFDAGNLVRKSYQQLKNCEKGSSGKALIYELWNRINRVMELEFENLKEENVEQNTEKDYYMVLDHVLILQCLLEEFLNRHDRIKYGKREARQFLAELRELPLVIFPTEQKAASIEKIRMGTTKSLQKLDKQFRQRAIKRLGGEERLKEAVEKIYGEYYENKEENRDILRNIVVKILWADREKPDAETCYYVMYLVQKKQIEMLMNNGMKEDWRKKILLNNADTAAAEQHYNFIFHSYLRYLQANESDAAKAGAEATAVAALATDLLESEGIADNRIISNIYEIVGKPLDLTEDEFAELFAQK